MNHKFWNPNKPEDIVLAVRNAEVSATIRGGSPVVLAMNGTDDGLAVVLPSSSTAAKIGAFQIGVAIRDMSPGETNDCQVYGFNRNARILRSTRAASTDAWASMAAITIGDLLSIDSVNNCFARSGAASNIGIKWPYQFAESIASATTLASSVLGINAASATAYIQNVKVFIRNM
jgi:hypothetical protein